ncbi:hypothetical protein [Tateyamaria sp.]|uniref:hypothetical protein n=1 Tax=Tateyamaria sp. TaxID=1929288 RepID=UPI00329B27E4
MPKHYPTLGDIWPYSEAAVPPELASIPVDVFFSDRRASSIQAAEWISPVDPEAAPRASYALRLIRGNGRGELACWDSTKGVWVTKETFLIPDTGTGCSIIELHGILLGNVQSIEALSFRLRSLLQSELSKIKAYRLIARVLSVMSIIVLFYAVRSGVESYALEPFLLIFTAAVVIGLLSNGLRNRCKSLHELAVMRVNEQFRFEYRKSLHAPLTIKDVDQTLRDGNRKGEEEAIIFGFLLLLCFVYFISTLVVVGVIVAVIVVTLITSETSRLRVLSVALERSKGRLEHSLLSFRASNDNLTPTGLRNAKKQVLRDRARRFADVFGKMRLTQSRFRLTHDLAIAVAFLIIFASYAFPIATGFQKLSVTKADSLVVTSLFSVAPVIILLSISKSTVALAQIINRKILALSR